MSIQPNYVFVLDINRKALTPCKPSLARKLLTVGKAKVFKISKSAPKYQSHGAWFKADVSHR